jgi:hypothetical protein
MSFGVSEKGRATLMIQTASINAGIAARISSKKKRGVTLAGSRPDISQ